jgi:hypothetical protein
MKQTEGRKSRDTVPLTILNGFSKLAGNSNRVLLAYQLVPVSKVCTVPVFSNRDANAQLLCIQ